MALAALMGIILMIMSTYGHAEPQIIPPRMIVTQDGIVMDEARLKMIGKMVEMSMKLHRMKEMTMDVIIMECSADFLPYEFYFCALSNLIALNLVVSHFDDLVEDIVMGTRPDEDTAPDFEMFIDLLEKHKTNNSYGGFNFPLILEEYEDYLSGKENVQ
jgi:hypothetical protein